MRAKRGEIGTAGRTVAGTGIQVVREQPSKNVGLGGTDTIRGCASGGGT